MVTRWQSRQRKVGPNQKMSIVGIIGNSYFDITDAQRALFSRLLEKPVHLGQMNQVLKEMAQNPQAKENSRALL